MKRICGGYVMKAYIMVEKDDMDTINILKENLSEYETAEEDSLSGADFTTFVIPALTIVFGSQAVKELIKGLMNKARIKVKFDGFEYEGEYKHLEDAVKQLKENEKLSESKKKTKKR